MLTKRFLTAGCIVAVALMAVTYGVVVKADNAWGNYHWERSANPMELTLGDNFSDTSWDVAYDVAVADWNQSSVLNLMKVGGATNPRKCKPAPGTIEVCSRRYGNNGWLGLAGISISGGHIVKAYALMNDTYFVTGGSYDTPAWRAMIMCQEIGHDFGVGHQDEEFGNLNLDTCMDYTSSPESNQHPNNHDYQLLEDIYKQLDSDEGEDPNTGTDPNNGPCRGGPKRGCAPPAFDMMLSGIDQWGELLETSADGGQSVFMQDFGNGHRVYTHVTWTLEVAEGLQNRGRR